MIEIDTDELARRATAAAQGWAGGCEVHTVSALEGGTVSLVYQAEVAGGPAAHPRVVLKIAPPGLPPVRNRDVLRQAACMTALEQAPGVRVPPVLFTDSGDPPEVPPFVGTGFVAGECREPLFDATVLPGQNQPMGAPVAPGQDQPIRERAFAAARMLAALHAVVPGEIGLGGEPPMSLPDEVQRWTRMLETVPDDLRVGYEDCAAALLAAAPNPSPPVVVHGDYRLGNMLCDGDRVNAIIDWEIWTISDPRIDLSWFLFFTDEAKHPVAAPGTVSEMPSDEDLLAAYERAVGRETRDLEWFHALTRYKEAAAMALIAKHIRRADPSSSADSMVDIVHRLIIEARDRSETLIRR